MHPKEPTAILFALTSPGAVPINEYTTWYDSDHAPSRAAVPGVITARRYKSLDAQRPEWLAVYELSSADVLESAPYKKLWHKEPKYEHDLIQRCDTLDRRVYTLMTRKTSKEYADIEGETAEKKKERVFMAVGLQPKPGSDLTDEEYNRWYEEEHIPLLAKVPGWLRSTRWMLKDAHGKDMAEVDKSKVPRFLAIHEWESKESLVTKEMKVATTTEWRARVMGSIDPVAEERRQFGLWKEFSCE
jgi:hypothetical protein